MLKIRVTSFDAKIVSHSYQNGQGVIKFETPVTKIGNYAFYRCDKLVSFTIPDEVTSIGYYAFAGCKMLSKITIPEDVTKVGYSAFRDCTSLPVEDGVKYADTYLVAAMSKTLTQCKIKPNTRFIGSNAFNGCKKLNSIIIKTTTLKTVGSNAFKGIDANATIKCPKGLKADFEKLLRKKGAPKTVTFK